jgi:hypothetical protein
MSVRIEWYDPENTIIYYEFTGHWTWEEFEAAYQQSLAMMKGVSDKVDFIVNMSHTDYVPPGALYHFKKIVEADHPMRGTTIWVGVNALMGAISDTFSSTFPSLAETYPFEFARTTAEAYENLMRHRREWR